MPVLTGPQVAALVRDAGFPQSVHVVMVAIAKAESGWNTSAVNTANRNGSVDRGLFQINSVHRFDAGRLLSDPAYNARCAKNIYDRQGLNAWTVYKSGAWRRHESAARAAVAGAASLTGSAPSFGSDAALEDGGSSGGITYGGPGPAFVRAGTGVAQQYAAPTSNFVLGSVKVLGVELEADIGTAVLDPAAFHAAIDEIPNLTLPVADAGHRLNRSGLFRVGTRVQWSDLDLRIDQAQEEEGAGTGRTIVTCSDDIVFALRNLRGARTASGISASEWIYQEMLAVGIDPNRYLLAESVPTQSEIARDVGDAAGSAGSGETPSAWTTIVRLAEELGKRVFVSGRRLVFGSAAFAMQWCAAAPLRLGWDGAPDGERFIDLPKAERTGVASRDAVLRVTGRVTHARGPYFRPGVPVDVYGLPGYPGTIRTLVESIDHALANDVDGPEIVLIEPVDPPPQPPDGPSSSSLNAGSTAAGGDVSGGGADGQVDRFVSICLSRAGGRYVFGAEARASDPNPRAFDCSELIEWAAARAGITPRVPDGSAAQIAHCRPVSVAQAIRTKGALLYKPGHIGVSLGNGRTIEAMNSRAGIRQGNANGRGWTRGGLIPGAKGYR